MSRRPSRIDRLREQATPAAAAVPAKAPPRAGRAAPLKGAAAPSLTADVDHVEHAAMLTLTNVPLNRLRLSDLNVRKTDRGEGIKALAADIARHGLKQNLVVVECGEAGFFEVVAGGRRLQALQHLWDEGTIDGDKAIAVLVEPRAMGRTTSLSENIQRIPMNPADECTAYATIVAEHAAEQDPIGHCAKVFGVMRSHVEQRLRLADLAEEIFAALREGRITLDAAKAYGTFADHDLQRAIFSAEEKRSYGARHDARNIRDAMNLKTYPVGIAQAVYVGLDAYRAAGGGLERDLFMGAEQGERLTSPTLLDKLARDKAKREIEDLAARDGFASGVLTATFGPYPASPKPPANHTQPYLYGKTLGDIAEDRRRAAIGIYRLAPDGAGLQWHGMFEPAVAARPQHQAPQESTAEREARHRRELVSARATQLAALPVIAGTDLEQRATWPDPDQGWIDAIRIDHDEPGVRYIAVYVRVTDEEVAAQEARAEAFLMAEEELARAQAAAASTAPDDPAAAVPMS